MRKRSLIAAGLMILCVGLTACGGSKGTDNGSTTQQQSQNTSTGYVFTTNGVNIAIDEKIEDITSKLGDPKGGYYEAKSCAFDGMDKFWYYDSFTLQGYQKNGVDVVYSVTFMDDTVKTKEGIKIGDSKDKVTSAYGSSYKEENGQIKYESGNMVLSFAIKDNAVTSIDIIHGIANPTRSFPSFLYPSGFSFSLLMLIVCYPF